MDKLEKLKKEIDNYLDKVLPKEKEVPEILHKAMRYSVFSGGKRLRPIIVLITGEIFSVSKDKLLPVACGIELIHNFSLIHDDLPAMDNDDFRRGKPTCHKKFGEDIAILAGDALLTLGFELIAKSKNPEIVKEIAYSIGSYGMAGGQTLDILYQNKKISEKLKKKIDGMKTGKLFEICFKVPLFFKKVRKKDKEILHRISKNFGIAFQIRDDIEDKEGDIEKLKKKLKLLYRKLKKDAEYFGKKATLLLEIIDKLYGKFGG
ncbi:polyprenyl synthetase family protein [bacterium]|nr:polyprenyl synthetase family protein [bacterium]